MPHHRHLWLALALLGLQATCSGCYRHRQAVADSAASIWEAAAAIERGVSPAAPAAAIKAQARAIIRAQGRSYPPAETAGEENQP